jgi:hypothetical protein
MIMCGLQSKQDASEDVAKEEMEANEESAANDAPVRK